MGERTRRMRIGVPIAAVLGLAAACSGTSDLSGTSATPSPLSTLGMPYMFGPCPHVVIYPKSDVPGYVAAYDWDDSVHAYGEAVSITACFDASSEAIPEGPPGVIFDPVQLQLPKTEYHVITFTVTVPEGSGGPIFVRLDYSGGGTFATAPGPVITPSGDGWKFTFPPEPES